MSAMNKLKKKNCKKCPQFHNAGHPKDSIFAKKYNSWCCKYGEEAIKAVLHCKLEENR